MRGYIVGPRPWLHNFPDRDFKVGLAVCLHGIQGIVLDCYAAMFVCSRDRLSARWEITTLALGNLWPRHVVHWNYRWHERDKCYSKNRDFTIEKVAFEQSIAWIGEYTKDEMVAIQAGDPD